MGGSSEDRDWLRQPLSRRSLLKAGAATAGAVSVAPLLAACGGDDESSPTTGQTPAAQSSPTSAAQTTPSPAGDDEDDPRSMGQLIEPAGSEGGTFVWGGVFEMDNFSPILNVDRYYNMSAIFESLVEPNPFTYEPVGCLAAGWEASEDGLTWAFNLREGVTWQDGKPFTSADVRATFETHEQIPGGELVGRVSGIETPDATTAVFTLPGVNADFLLGTATYFIGAAHVLADADPAALEQHPSTSASDLTMVVGTGPFRLTELVPGDHITLTGYDGYWDGAPHLDEIIYRVLASYAAGFPQLQTGDLDWLYVEPDLLAELETSENLRVAPYSSTGIDFYATNLDPDKSPYFQDERVRKALLYAIDRRTMVEAVLLGYGEVAHAAIATDSWVYSEDAMETRYDFDPARATTLLDEAGWLAGSDGVREKDGVKLAFNGWTQAGWQLGEQIMAAIQEYWRQVGVDMTIQVEPDQPLFERYASTHEYDVLLWVTLTGGGPVPDQTSLWACESYPDGGNRFKYCNPEVDALSAEALVELDREARIGLYQQIQNIIMDDLPIGPLFTELYTDGVNRRVHNFYPNQTHPFFNAETWWVEA
jgi:peptide/nickel transport system substrate-binding protein